MLKKIVRGLISSWFVLAVWGGLRVACGQDAAADQAASIYKNYAIDGYTQETMEDKKTKYYDLFGEHIADGYNVYNFENYRQDVSSNLIADSTHAVNTAYRHNYFYESLNNLVLSQDEIGGAKMLFLVGDQIHTKFTPLTFNKRNFSGLRWDLWSQGLKMTSILTRTRPGIMARQGIAGRSYVTYPNLQYISSSWNSPDVSNWANNGSASYPLDWSQHTFYGDYDLLFGFHAENKVANLVNVGVTYLNHHHSDMAKGEKLFQGNLPDGIVPQEIHFEFSDLTPDIVTDAGVLVENLVMKINGQVVGGLAGVYLVRGGMVKDINLKYYVHKSWFDTTRYALPCTANGTDGIICTFNPVKTARAAGIDSSQIKSVSFDITVAGNYQVFVSCERIVSQDENHIKDYSTIRQVPVDTVFNRHVVSLQKKKQMYFDEGTFGANNAANSEIYFGNYIAMAPNFVQTYDNRTTIQYEFALPVSNVTYGFNFDGKIAGLSFSGEYATSQVETQAPFLAGERTSVQNQAGFLKLNYDVMKDVVCKADLYNIDAAYRTDLGSFQVSQFFNSRSLLAANNVKHVDVLKYALGYQSYPLVLDNDYRTIDDNDDNDYYVENDRRKYPAGGQYNTNFGFYADGTLRSYAYNQEDPRTAVNVLQEKRVQMPNGLYRIYEDMDGVIADRYDKNKNGIKDYVEDFLLYKADLPVFNLEKDDNNNGVYDIEEDNLWPDLPYQQRMGYVFTGNGWQSQGLRGLNGVVDYDRIPNLKLNLGGMYETVLDHNGDGKTDALGDNRGRNTGLFARGIYEYSKRTSGIQLFAGEELKRSWDGIRNDAVETWPRTNTGVTEVDYTIRTDNLRHLNALSSNTVVGLTYASISNFELTSKMAVGFEKHFAEDSLLLTRSFAYNPDDKYYQKARVYQSVYRLYDDKSINSLHFMAKLGYTIKFVKEYRGTWSFLNFTQNIQIVPQYKLTYLYQNAHNQDPRDRMTVETIRADSLGTLFDLQEFQDYNSRTLISVPIIKLNFKIGEKTFLESGMQWQRTYDGLIKENSYRRVSTIAQIANRSSIQGYDVAIIFGYSNVAQDYDINSPSIYGFGSTVDEKHYSIFCKIFAGIVQ
jgi:hypothetical protein